MASSIRLSSNIFSHNFTLKSKYLPQFLYSRHFCSSDNDSKTERSSVNDSTSDEKLKENAKKASARSKTSRFKAKPVSDETKEAAKEKLMSLLSEITIASDSTPSAKLDIARAVKRVSKKDRLQKMKEEIITPEKEMKMAVKAVASNFKEDSEKVESEITEKLKSLKLSQEMSEKEVSDTKDSPLIDDNLSANLMTSVEEVAETISENPIPPRTELTERLMRLSLDKKLKSSPKSVRSVIESMVIKSEPPLPKEKKQRMTSKRFPMRKQIYIEKIDLFGAEPLNIFDPNAESKPDSSNTFWQKLQERELRLSTQFAPANAFEEMIMWTEHGKHWKLPIDNETEMGAEENVGFHEHVFLEHHLKGFPTKGPIRHFMELVCVGLSKNPYVTVERKIENIEWFRDYFKEKEELLRDAGALD